MDYITKQKFNIGELVNIPETSKRVLLIIGEEILRNIYHSYLENNGFTVYSSHFSDPIKIAEALPNVGLLIIDIKETESMERLEFMKLMAKNFSAISVITVGYALEEKYLRELMALGVIGHINRKFSRPQDLVTIAKSVFIN